MSPDERKAIGQQTAQEACEKFDRNLEAKLQKQIRAAFGLYKVCGIQIIECLSCGYKEQVETPKDRKLFRARHSFCHQL